jgi:hypothetical protein
VRVFESGAMRRGWAESRVWRRVHKKPLLRPYKRSAHKSLLPILQEVRLLRQLRPGRGTARASHPFIGMLIGYFGSSSRVQHGAYLGGELIRREGLAQQLSPGSSTLPKP